MLTLDINNKYLALDPGTTVQVIAKNPACFSQKIVSNAGLNIHLPDNDVNRAILGDPAAFDKYAPTDTRKFTGATLAFSGAELVAGTLVVVSATDGFSCWIQSDLSVFGEEQQEKFITEMSWPTGQTLTTASPISLDDTTDEYSLYQIRNSGFWEGVGKEHTPDYTFLDANGSGETREITRSYLSTLAIKNYSSMINIFNRSDIKAGCVISPYLYLRHVIKEVLRMNKWFIDRNDITDDPNYATSMFKNLAVYNNYNIVDAAFTTEETELSSWDYRTAGLLSKTVKKITAITWGIQPFSYASLLPRIRFKEFILDLQNALNIIFVFHNDKSVDIIDRNEILNGTAYNISSYQVAKWDPGNRKDLRFKFATAYDKDDANYANDYEDLSDRWADFADPVETFDNLALLGTVGELRLVKDENNIYEYKWMVVSDDNGPTIGKPEDAFGWEFVSTGPQPYISGSGDEEEEIKSGLSTIKYNHVGTPDVVQRGNLESIKNLYNNFSFRLIAPSEAAGEKLSWEGENGIFKNRWETWARFWRQRLDVSTRFRLPMNLLVYIQKNITKKYNTTDGAFIIEEMNTTFKMHSIGETTIKGYKV